MKETGIIMSGDHPRKILDGTKTMTRRTAGLGKVNEKPADWSLSGRDIFHYWLGQTAFIFHHKKTGEEQIIKCPYGQVGDRLWVREKYSIKPQYDRLSVTEVVELYGKPEDIWYGSLTQCFWTGRARPSIHMPRWASRIERIITLLRAERLRDISEADAMAEGGYSIEEFIEVYIRINHLPEDANPWNWVIGW